MSSNQNPLESQLIQGCDAKQPHPVHRSPPSLALPPDANPSAWHHNFDLSTREGKDSLINASNVADWIPSDGSTCMIDCVHYLVYPDQYVDRQTGEIVQTTALVLIGKNGMVCKFQNEWSLRRIHAAMQMYTAEEWAQGIPIECYVQKSRQPGRTYGSFRILPHGTRLP